MSKRAEIKRRAEEIEQQAMASAYRTLVEKAKEWSPESQVNQAMAIVQAMSEQAEELGGEPYVFNRALVAIEACLQAAPD